MAPNAARKKVVNHSDFLLGVVLFMVPTIGPMQMFSDLEQNAPDPARRDLLGYGSEASGHSLGNQDIQNTQHFEQPFGAAGYQKMDDVISLSTCFQGPKKGHLGRRQEVLVKCWMLLPHGVHACALLLAYS